MIMTLLAFWYQFYRKEIEHEIEILLKYLINWRLSCDVSFQIFILKFLWMTSNISDFQLVFSLSKCGIIFTGTQGLIQDFKNANGNPKQLSHNCCVSWQCLHQIIQNKKKLKVLKRSILLCWVFQGTSCPKDRQYVSWLSDSLHAWQSFLLARASWQALI